jgi:hypothetical protein
VHALVVEPADERARDLADAALAKSVIRRVVISLNGPESLVIPRTTRTPLRPRAEHARLQEVDLLR